VAQRGTSTVAQPRGRRGAFAVSVAFFAFAAFVLAANGCRSRSPGQEPDAAAAGCAGTTVCDGTEVRACRMGSVAEVLEDCAPSLTCSLGRCTSSDCADADQNRGSLLGCTFYTFELDNVESDDPLPTSVLVTNPGQSKATVTLERRDAIGWTGMANLVVAPMLSARFALADGHVAGGGLAAHAAFRLTSDAPVSAMHVQSDDSAPGGSSSTGGTMLLPAHVLGVRYRALTYGQVATPRLQATKGARGGAGELVVVGTVDQTNVAIVPSATAALGPEGGAPPPDMDGKLHVTLDEGDVLTLFSSRDGADLTGTEISADQPIAVFSGNISTTYGISATGVSSPDLAHEQLLPVSDWGRVYVAAALTPQANVCDPVLTPPGSSLWTIVADFAGTQVHFQVASGAPPAPDRTIGAGESFHLSAVGDFAVTASAPIQIMQGMDCEPTLSSAVPATVFLKDHRFGVLPNFDTMIAVVRLAGDPVFFDGARIEDSLFEPAGAGFDVAHIPLPECSPAEDVCTHHLEGKFGFTMRGMDVTSSYALTAPTWKVPCDDAMAASCN
jgi:IgGFc binding protein